MAGIETNQRVVAEFNDVVDSRDLTRLEELCTPDLVNHALAPSRPQGLEGTRQFLSESGWRTDTWLERRIVAQNDLVVEHGVRGGEWPGAVFRGIPVPAGTYTREVAFVYRLAGGRIAERWAVRDDLGMMLQLGADLGR
jgi:predicted ester cyclase